MKAFVLAAVAVMVLASPIGPAVSQPLASGAASSEALSKRDLRAQRREARHLQAKQKKLLKRQRVKMEQHRRRER
jgi:hypothetical protein